jgi:hypothetical protein
MPPSTVVLARLTTLSLLSVLLLAGATSALVATGATPTPLAGSVPLVEAATGNNTFEDTFTRPNQTGWGTTTNPDGVPNVTWGLDGSGSKFFVTM